MQTSKPNITHIDNRNDTNINTKMRNTWRKIHEIYLKVKDKNSEKSASFIVRLKAGNERTSVLDGKLFHACKILCEKVSTNITGALWGC